MTFNLPRRQRAARLKRGFAGSLLLHGIVAVVILLFMLEHAPDEPKGSNPVEVIFEPSPPSGAKPEKPGQSSSPAPEAGPVTPLPTATPQSMPTATPQSMPTATPQSMPTATPQSMPVPPPPVAPPVALAPPTPVVPETPPVAAATAAPVEAATLPEPPLPPATATAALPPRSVPRPPPPRQPAQPRQPAVPRAQPGSELSAPMDFTFGGPPSASRLRPSGRANSVDTAIGGAAANAPGPPPTDTGRSDPSIRVSGAQLGSDWIAMLHAWWDQHGYYPPQAARLGEDGTVRIRFVVDRYGHVSGLLLTGRSGSQWLDLAAQAVFRGASLPPFPPSTPQNQATLDLTIRYYLVGR